MMHPHPTRRIVYAALALLAVLVCLALPFHDHATSHASETSCAVCHLADSPVVATATQPFVAPRVLNPLCFVTPTERPIERLVFAAPSRGPPAPLLA